MLNKEKNFVSSVVYVHNAEKRIGTFISVIMKVMEDNFENFEIICVNDCSTDNSVHEIKSAVENHSSACVSVVNLSYYHGIEMAMNAGIDLAIGDFVFEFICG